MNVRTVTVLGAGTMGHGIAHAAAASGFETRLYDVSDAAARGARRRSSAVLQEGRRARQGDGGRRRRRRWRG